MQLPSNTNYTNFMLIAKEKVRRILPTQLRKKVGHSWGSLLGWKKRRLFIPNLLSNYIYDCGRFLRWSSVNNKAYRKTQLQAAIIMDYHRIEKGLALRQPRIGFGKPVIERLVSNLSKYQEKFGFDETTQVAINALFAYYRFNLEHQLENSSLHRRLVTLKEKMPQHFKTIDSVVV